VDAVRYGNRSKLAAVLGSAMFIGWLLGQHGPRHESAR
jgi:hypothetical protein